MPDLPAVRGLTPTPSRGSDLGLSSRVAEIFADSGSLAQSLPTFESRPAQREMDKVAELIMRALATPNDDAALVMVKVEVEKLCRMFPLYGV